MDLTAEIHADTLAAIEGGNFCPVVLVYLDWPSGAVRMHSNVGTIQWGGHDWLGIGTFGAIEVPEEGVGLAQNTADLLLIGSPVDVQEYLDEPIRGRDAQIYFGVVSDRSGNVLIGEPFDVFNGKMDALGFSIEAAEGGVTYGLRLTVADGPSQREAAAAFHTDEDQRRRFPNDTAGRWVQLSVRQSLTLKWPE